ncbi:MAG: hypothetical protein AAF361_00455 [Bacteroidota bacterium]
MQLRYISMILIWTLSSVVCANAQIAPTPDKADIELSAYSVSLSDDAMILAIGDHQGDKGNTKSGQVRIYKNISGCWHQIGDDINGEAAGDLSGYSVGLSADGSTVAIGAKRNHGLNGKNSGHVRVYKNNAGVWEQIGEDIDGKSKGDSSGYSVGLSGDGTTVAIGAIFNNTNGKFSGHVRVYKNYSGKWVQIGADINGKAAKDYFGASVSLSGNGEILAIGAHRGGAPSSYVSVYKNVSGRWVQIGKDIVGEPTGNFLGWNISMSESGNSLAIAAYNNSKGERYAYVRTYQNNGKSWMQLGADIDGRTMDRDLLGFNSMSLGNDGTITLIGAYSQSGKNVPAINYLRRFRFNKWSDKWIRI